MINKKGIIDIINLILLLNIITYQCDYQHNEYRRMSKVKHAPSGAQAAQSLLRTEVTIISIIIIITIIITITTAIIMILREEVPVQAP